MINFTKFTEKMGKTVVSKLGCPEDPKLASKNQMVKVYIFKQLLETVTISNVMGLEMEDIKHVITVLKEMLETIEKEASEAVNSSRNN